MNYWKNKYIYRSNLSIHKFRKIAKFFCMDVTATQVAEMAKVNRNTANKYIAMFRKELYDYSEQMRNFKQSTKSTLQTKFDDVYIKHFNDNLNHLTIQISSINDKIYTSICSSKQCDYFEIKTNRGAKYSTTITMSLSNIGFDGLTWESFNKLKQNYYSKISFKMDDFLNIETFLHFYFRRTRKFRGLYKANLVLHLRETEVRFNHTSEELYKMLLMRFRKKHRKKTKTAQLVP